MQLSKRAWTSAAMRKRTNFRWISSRCFASDPSSERVNIAFVGAGDIARLHFLGVQKTPQANLKGIWSLPGCKVVTDPEQVARDFGCDLYSDPEDIFQDEEIDAVYVLTNMETHADFAIRAMDAGKHVLVEKPVASSIEEIKRMKDASERNGVVCFPAHNYIYESWFQRTHEMIRNGDVGDIAAMYIMYNIHHADKYFSRDSILGVLRQIGTHLAYMSIYLGGDPVEVSAMKASIGTSVENKENVVLANVRMKSGALAHLEANFAADDHGSDPWSVYVKVIGTKGSARYSYNDWVINAPLAGSAHSHTYVHQFSPPPNSSLFPSFFRRSLTAHARACTESVPSSR